jgi:hypothetical protein
MAELLSVLPDPHVELLEPTQWHAACVDERVLASRGGETSTLLGLRSGRWAPYGFWPHAGGAVTAANASTMPYP